MERISREKKKGKRRASLKHLFRSGLEDDLAKQLRKRKVDYKYEQSRIPYIVPSSSHIYIPDFEITTNSGNTIIIEAKGIWTYEDRYKHLLIKQQYPELDIRFIFTRAKSKITRKSKTTYKDICEGRGRGIFKGVTWQYADKKIPDDWFRE